MLTHPSPHLSSPCLLFSHSSPFIPFSRSLPLSCLHAFLSPFFFSTFFLSSSLSTWHLFPSFCSSSHLLSFVFLFAPFHIYFLFFCPLIRFLLILSPLLLFCICPSISSLLSSLLSSCSPSPHLMLPTLSFPLLLPFLLPFLLSDPPPLCLSFLSSLSLLPYPPPLSCFLFILLSSFPC